MLFEHGLPTAHKSARTAGDAGLRDAGFRWGDRGTHTSRTIMLDELRAVLERCPPDASRDDYLTAIHDDNCLGKRTAATRKLSSQRLSELYGLDPSITLFRVMRRCWYADRDAKELLAMLLALARDPLLRASAPSVLGLRLGEELARQHMTDAIRGAIGERLSDSTLDKVVRNAASDRVNDFEALLFMKPRPAAWSWRDPVRAG